MQVFCGSAGRCSELAKGMGLGQTRKAAANVLIS